MRTSRLMILMAVLVTACSPKVYPPQINEDIRVSVVEKEIPRDTVVVIKKDSTMLTALVECNARGEARLLEIEQLRNSLRAQTTLSLEDNRLEVKTVVDSMAIYLTLRDRFKETEKVETITVTETVEVNILHWWQEVLIRVGAVSLVVLVLWVVFKLLKPRLNGILTVVKNFLNK